MSFAFFLVISDFDGSIVGMNFLNFDLFLLTNIPTAITEVRPIKINGYKMYTGNAEVTSSPSSAAIPSNLTFTSNSGFFVLTPSTFVVTPMFISMSFPTLMLSLFCEKVALTSGISLLFFASKLSRIFSIWL